MLHLSVVYLWSEYHTAPEVNVERGNHVTHTYNALHMLCVCFACNLLRVHVRRDDLLDLFISEWNQIATCCLYSGFRARTWNPRFCCRIKWATM